MVMVVGSMEPKPGKVKAAREYIKRFAAYDKKTFGVDWEILSRLTSSPGQHAKIYVMTRHESVAAWGELQEKQTEDDGWQKFVDEGFLGKDAILVHNSFSRSVFRVL